MENISSAPIKQPKDDISMQLKELLTIEILIALYPNQHKLATLCLSITISSTSTEQSFSDMKLIISNSIMNFITTISKVPRVEVPPSPYPSLNGTLTLKIPIIRHGY